jgi:hypothetical protein
MAIHAVLCTVFTGVDISKKFDPSRFIGKTVKEQEAALKAYLDAKSKAAKA